MPIFYLLTIRYAKTEVASKLDADSQSNRLTEEQIAELTLVKRQT